MALSRRSLISGALSAGALQSAETVRLPRKIRLGMVGLEGHTSEILNPLRNLPDIELAAYSDPDMAALRRMGRNPLASRARAYSDARELLEKEQLDIAAICGDNGSRADLIIRAVQRKMHIVAEKPLAIDAAGLQKIESAVSDAGVRLTMLLPMRFLPAYLGMRRIVRSGEIGEVVQIGAQKSYKLGERSEWMRHRKTFGGTIPYIGIHMVDLMRFTSGRELVEAASFQARIGHEEMLDMENTTSTIFRLDNGGTGALRMDYLRPETAPTHGDDRLRLAGTKGIVEYQEGSGVTLMTGDRKPTVITDLPAPQSLFVDFLNSTYLGKSPALELKDIYRVNRIVLSAREAAERHAIVQL